MRKGLSAGRAFCAIDVRQKAGKEADNEVSM